METTRKIIASLAATALLVALGAAVSFWSFRQLGEAAEARKHTRVVIENANDLLSALRDAETGQRGYALTGDETYLEPYLAVRDSFNGHLEKLRLLTSSNAAHKHLDAVAPLIAAKLAEMAQVIALRRNHDMTAVLAMVGGGQGKRLMDSIRAEMSRFDQIEEEMWEQHETVFHSNMHRLFVAMVVASLLTLLAALSFVYFIYRESQQRLRDLVHLETLHLLEVQEETNKRLLDQQIYTRSLIESNIDALITTDPSGTITDVNKQMEALTGCTRIELIGTPFKNYFTDPGRAEAGIQLVLSEKKVSDYELTARASDGKKTVVSYNATTFYDRNDKLQGVFAAARDVTERKKTGEALLALKDDLENRVHSRTAELETANKELEAFAYSVSHDLRAPLRAIDGFSRKVIMGYGEQLGDEGRRQLQVVRDNAQSMGQLIDDLLAFSRMGRREMALQPLDMDAMVKGVADELRAAEPQRAIEFACTPLPRALGDAAMLRQVWVNLLSNAVKFTRQRQVAHIEVGGRTEGGEVTYWVKDDGAGFDMRYADKLFGVFQRLHRQDEFEGTGVGLAIAQRILHRHNGHIWGEGKPDAGATFSFALPLPTAPDNTLSGEQPS